MVVQPGARSLFQERMILAPHEEMNRPKVVDSNALLKTV